MVPRCNVMEKLDKHFYSKSTEIDFQQGLCCVRMLSNEEKKNTLKHTRECLFDKFRVYLVFETF